MQRIGFLDATILAKFLDPNNDYFTWCIVVMNVRNSTSEEERSDPASTAVTNIEKLYIAKKDTAEGDVNPF